MKKTNYQIKILRIIAGILISTFVLANAGSMAAQAAPRVQPVGDVVTIVIDPGHGGVNEGTIENGFLEKSMTMTTALAMYEELCKYDNVEVYLTRTEDVDMSLKERAEFAASVNADFLFSIHYNASLNHELYGSEVWISAFPPYNAYGYQFGSVQLQTMQDMGLFLRGVKTRLNDKDLDYYGIIREARELSVPAVIIEHCHVDEERDVPFCDDEADLIAFGKADALSVAKYFGLKSSELNVDYSTESTNLAEASENSRVQNTLTDKTEPDICQITLLETDYNTGKVTIEVSAADYDSMLLYYDYSIDGGASYSSREPWPGCNVFDGTYTDTFSTTLMIPAGIQSTVIFRAYNLFDLYTESNTEIFQWGFADGQEEDAVAVDGRAVAPPENGTAADAENEAGTNYADTSKYPGTTTFQPDSPETEEMEKEVSILSFLKICLIIVVILFALVLVSQMLTGRRRKRRRHRR